MKARTSLYSCLLLGVLVVAPDLRAQEAVDAAATEAVQEVTPADTVPEETQVADVTEEAPADEESDADTEVPAWVGRVLVTAEAQPGADGQPVSDRVLRVVQRSTTGGELARKAVLSLLSGTVGGSTFKKNQLHGTRVESVPNPAYNYLKDKMRESLGVYFAAHPGAIPEEEVWVQSTVGEFILVYKELGDAQTEYELRQAMHVGFPYRRKLLRLTGGEGATCSAAEPVSAPLDAWQADDYAMVKQVAQRYTDDCAARFAATLPTLFPDRTPVAVEPAAPAAPVETADGA